MLQVWLTPQTCFADANGWTIRKAVQVLQVVACITHRLAHGITSYAAKCHSQASPVVWIAIKLLVGR